MLLNDIGGSPSTTLRKINQYLESNYGFKIIEDTRDRDLVAIMETIHAEITDLKSKGDTAKGSPEISKRLLVLEGIKTLREFAVMQFQSSKLEPLVRTLIDQVVREFSRGGTNMSDFDNELRNTMNAYRSSEFRFPDDYIEQRVKDGALSILNNRSSNSDVSTNDPILESEIEDESDNADEESEMKGIDGTVSEDTITEIRRATQTNETESGLDRSYEYRDWRAADQTSNQQQNKEQVPMKRNPHTGEMQVDPFAAQAAERRKGIVMKEHVNLVKNLRRLLETEVSQAEVMMAAKGFAQELQEMVEKIGRLQNEDLPPVTDQMRETYGGDSASAFQTQIYGALQSVMDSLYTAKGQVDDAVANMAETGQVTASVDMDKDIGDPDALGGETGMDTDQEIEPELDLDNIGDELGAQTDEFGGAEGDEPLGRSVKTESLQHRVMEMKKLVAKAKKLKEMVR